MLRLNDEEADPAKAAVANGEDMPDRSRIYLGDEAAFGFEPKHSLYV
jgi:hypothetical protein